MNNTRVPKFYEANRHTSSKFEVFRPRRGWAQLGVLLMVGSLAACMLPEESDIDDVSEDSIEAPEAETKAPPDGWEPPDNPFPECGGNADCCLDKCGPGTKRCIIHCGVLPN